MSPHINRICDKIHKAGVANTLLQVALKAETSLCLW
jgi:hypothetical protein